MPDPAFLFYPGDYLRDTQCLSENVQVSYDRIMCEHMRNICISQQQLNFFTKRLNSDEKNELMHLLKKTEAGYQIEWVALSISKRKSYSESRAENRKGKHKNISKTYDVHMENEIENENEIKNNTINAGNIFFELTELENKNSIEYIDRTAQKKYTSTELINLFAAFKIQYEKEFYPNRAKLIQHFRNWLKQQKNGIEVIRNGNKPNHGSAAGAISLIQRVKKEFDARGGSGY